MASVKGSNTSKTAHVMNLLSRNRGAEPPLPTDGAAALLCRKTPMARRHPLF